MHAGGIVWSGPYLHVAATARGLVTCRVDDIMRVPDVRGSRRLTGSGSSGEQVASYGYRYVLPVRFSYRAHADEGNDPLRYSFLSLDRSAEPPALVAGEYGGPAQTTRLARYDLDPDTLMLQTGDDGRSRPLGARRRRRRRMQGAASSTGRYHVTVSHGPWMPGSVYVGTPGDDASSTAGRPRWAPRTSPTGPRPTGSGRSASTRAGAGCSR